MSLDVGYSYCTNLTEQEKLDIDKQVRKNRLELRFAVFFRFQCFQRQWLHFFRLKGLAPNK